MNLFKSLSVILLGMFLIITVVLVSIPSAMAWKLMARLRSLEPETLGDLAGVRIKRSGGVAASIGGDIGTGISGTTFGGPRGGGNGGVAINGAA